MKRCTGCGAVKPLSEFQVRRASKDGLTASCKVCQSKRDARRIDDPKRVAARKQIAAERRADPERAALDAGYKREWAARNRHKRQAHIIADNAIRIGKLVVPEHCERCPATEQLHAHHEDYLKPLEVVWLCPTCHGQRHREINAERRMEVAA